MRSQNWLRKTMQVRATIGSMCDKLTKFLALFLLDSSVKAGSVTLWSQNWLRKTVQVRPSAYSMTDKLMKFLAMFLKDRSDSVKNF